MQEELLKVERGLCIKYINKPFIPFPENAIKQFYFVKFFYKDFIIPIVTFLPEGFEEIKEVCYFNDKYGYFKFMNNKIYSNYRFYLIFKNIYGVDKFKEIKINFGEITNPFSGKKIKFKICNPVLGYFSGFLDDTNLNTYDNFIKIGLKLDLNLSNKNIIKLINKIRKYLIITEKSILFWKKLEELEKEGILGKYFDFYFNSKDSYITPCYKLIYKNLVVGELST